MVPFSLLLLLNLRLARRARDHLLEPNGCAVCRWTAGGNLCRASCQLNVRILLFMLLFAALVNLAFMMPLWLVLLWLLLRRLLDEERVDQRWVLSHWLSVTTCRCMGRLLLMLIWLRLLLIATGIGLDDDCAAASLRLLIFKLIQLLVSFVLILHLDHVLLPCPFFLNPVALLRLLPRLNLGKHAHRLINRECIVSHEACDSFAHVADFAHFSEHWDVVEECPVPWIVVPRDDRQATLGL